jgi:hypothetical protein
MYFDNLTLAGIAVVAVYALLPFVFGREMLRVEEDGDGPKAVAGPDGQRPTSTGCPGAPCHGA